MSVALSEAIQQAEVAIDNADFQSAVETCRRIIDQYPGFATAYQVLGQAYLKQGQAGEAEQAFSRTLASNPRQAPAYLGLGLIAEERGSLDNALAYCQVAWELAPQAGRYREPVVRIASHQFGADGQLQLTRAALAQLHANSTRFRRAVNEYQTALSELPDRVDLWMGLAETLWQLGEDGDAAEISREFLQEYPDLVQALVILADVERRQGNNQEADRLRQQLRQSDPDGAVVAAMLAANSLADGGYLQIPADEAPIFDEQADIVVAERPHIAPAPDFTYQPPAMDATAGTAGPAEASQAAPEMAASEDMDDLTDDFAGLQPMEPEEFGIDEAEMSAGTSDADSPDLDDLFSHAASDQATVSQQPGDVSAEHDMSDLIAQFDDAQPVSPDEFGIQAGSSEAESEELADLAKSLEDSVAGAVDRAMDPAEQTGADESEPAPPASSGTGYTTLLGELGQEGLRPFDPAYRGSAAGSESAADAAADEADDFASLTKGWDDLDSEIQSAIPSTPASTEDLRMLDDLGLDPFTIEEEDADTDKLGAFNPFGTIPPAQQTSAPSAGTSENEADETPAPDAGESEQPLAAADEAAASPSENDLFEGVEPFSFDEFDDEGADDQAFSFSHLPWEESAGGSALPGDEDLDAMLGSASSQVSEPDTAASSAPASASDSEEAGPAGQDEIAETGQSEEPSSGEPAPSPEWYEFDDPMSDLDASMAVTRELGESGPAEAEFEQQLSEAEAAAAENLQQFQDTREAPRMDDAAAVEEDEAAADQGPSTDLFSHTDAEKLVADGQLFERSRVAKNELIAEGVIRGDLELTGEQPAGEAAGPEMAPAPEPSEPFEVSTGATQDVDTLRTSLQAAPDDDELHWWLAGALRDRGDIAEAFTEYRWLIRNAPARHQAVIQALKESVEREQNAEMAHRLLADIYRRHGDSSMAGRHASMAMAERRRNR